MRYNGNEICNIYKELRYYSNLVYLRSLFPISSPSPSPSLPFSLPKTLIFPSNTDTSFSSSPLSQSLHCYRRRRRRLEFTHILPIHTFLRSFSSTPNDNDDHSNLTPNQVLDIVEVIKIDDTHMESKLNFMNLSLSIASLTHIFRALNSQRVSVLRFFYWIRISHPQLSSSSDICSLVINNCGCLDDYDAMTRLLKDFKLERICLTHKAFGFLLIFGSAEASLINSVRRLIDMLNEVGGSCRSSGILALIEMFGGLGLFDIAKFVMELTERKTSYYNILVRELCRRCDFKQVRQMLDEMRLLGCHPDAKSYNYLLGSLCKNDLTIETYNVLLEMREKSCLPDALTFEIFIYHSCRLGKLEIATDFLNKMIDMGIEPRLSTHAAFIKAYFNSCQYEEAYNYVVGSWIKYKCSSNMTYSLLANLHQRKGNLVTAQKILIEMIDKGLNPNFSIYMRVLKRLRKSGRVNLASDLIGKFSSLRLPKNIGIELRHSEVMLCSVSCFP